ncbi:hypothetical protein OG800_49570 (plasmid) [Streptomyces sp. NBC_00445]|uniref:hypothetical protein n=1 Tax=Streptomyces sp. NBC_00445 TaxID=2975745 RepID=UPI002E1A7EF1
MNCPAPAPGAAERLAHLDLKNFLSEGYSDEEVTAVLGPVAEATGVHVICLWDYVDRYGCGGDSDWYVMTPSGALHRLAGGLFSWINYGEGKPCDPATWIGNATGVTSSTLAAVDPYNHARRQC